MTQIVSSISGLEIYAPSAGYAPTNSADVSAIASGYAGIGSSDASAIASAYAQSAVSSVSGEYYGTGNVSGFATTAYVDSAVSGVEISFDSSITTASSTAGVTAGVNTAILSAYAYESSNSAKLDATAQVVSATASAYDMDSYAWATEINGLEISAAKAYSASYATTAETAYSADFASSSDKAIYDTNGRFLSSFVDSSYVDSAVSSKADSSALSSYALSSDVSSTIDTVSNNSASWGAGVSLPITGSAGTDSATYGETSVEFNRYDTAGEPDIRTATLSPDALNIMSTVDGNDYYSVNINENGIEFGDPDGYYSVNPSDISTWNSAVETVSNNSASWAQSGVDSATVSSIASSYAASAVSAASGNYYPMTGNPSSFATTNYVDSAVSGVEISFDSSIATASSTAGITASVNTAILSAYAYESSNSAKLDATAFSTVSANFLTSQTVTALGDDGTYITSINGSALSGQGGGGGASLPITGSVGTDSATYGETSVEYTRYDTAGEPDIRTASLSPDALDITYTVDENDYYSVRITDSVIEFSDPDGYYDITPYDITNWNSAVETVANNSASWGGGGAQVVTATGSASATAFTGGYPPIATSYMVSSINGSALLTYGYSTLSGNSANWTSTNSAVSANSAKWTSTNSAVSANSAKWTSTNSAVSANSAKWNSTRNVVTANSANWNSAYSLISGVTALMDAI